VHNLVLGAHCVTNLTFPFHSEINPSISEDSKSLKQLFSNCGMESKNKEITLLFDIMPTVTLFHYPITLAFTDQKSTISCAVSEKQNNKNNKCEGGGKFANFYMLEQLDESFW
jgi:hypothetical protein